MITKRFAPLLACGLSAGTAVGCATTGDGYEPAPEKYSTLPDDGPVDLSVPPGAILAGEINVSVGQDEMQRFVFTKEAGKHYTIGLSQMSADLDLFSHWVPDVSRSNFQFSSWAYGTTDEQIDLTASQDGDYFIGIHGFEAGQAVLQLFVSSGGSGGASTDEVGWPVEWGSDSASEHDLVGGGLGWLEVYDYGGACGDVHHPGLDMNFGSGADDLGKPVTAVANGVVVGSGYSPNGWGNVMTIEHTLSTGVHFVSLYGHLKDRFFDKGASVTRGQQIGTVGKPPGGSPHLHFEIRRDTGLGTFDFPCGWSEASVEATYDEPAEFIRTH
ncbi:MAG: M23 family metallopeptidase [Polyangiaceae bacterium]